MLATLPLRHSTCPALPSLRLHPISPRPFTRQRHGARAGTGAFRLLGRTAREGDLEGGRGLGGGCSAAQALAAIVHEGRAAKEERANAAHNVLRSIISHWQHFPASTSTFSRTHIISHTVQLIQHGGATRDSTRTIWTEPVAVGHADERGPEALHVPRRVALVAQQEGAKGIFNTAAYLAEVLLARDAPEYGHNVLVAIARLFEQQRRFQQSTLVLFSFLLPLLLNLVSSPPRLKRRGIKIGEIGIGMQVSGVGHKVAHFIRAEEADADGASLFLGLVFIGHPGAVEQSARPPGRAQHLDPYNVARFESRRDCNGVLGAPGNLGAAAVDRVAMHAR